MPSLHIFFFCYCQFMSLLLYQIDFVTKVEFYAKQNYLVSFHKIILSRKSNEIKICALLHEWYLNPILLLNKICSREENPGKFRFFHYSFSYTPFQFFIFGKIFLVQQCSVQGLVKGAELCLNPYFFGWLEKWVGWL